MDQQLAVCMIAMLWMLFTTVHTGTVTQDIKTDIFADENDKNSSPPPAKDVWFYERDIVLRDHQRDLLDVSSKSVYTKKAFSPGAEYEAKEKKVWFGGVIPYVFDCSLKNMPGLIAMIKGAMKEWESKTCLSFVERKQEDDYVRIIRGTHCYSTVGLVKGEKVLSIGSGCEFHNVILHELGHTIGFWHEQSRPDRDEHVRVLWRNISPGWESAFIKLSYKVSSTLLLPYDYSSIMHYPFNAFSKNPRHKTIVPLNPVKATPYKKLSQFDVLRAKMLFGCEGKYTSDDVEGTDASSMEVFRRMKRAIDVVNIDYGVQRNQRSVECKNHDDDEACQYWAEKGFCVIRKDFMLEDCAKSCNSCRTDADLYNTNQHPLSTSTGSQIVPDSVAIAERNERIKRRESRRKARKARKEIKELFKKRKICQDKKKSCSYWAIRGFCAARPDFMFKHCAKSCKKCYPDPSTCVDRDSRCKAWAKNHYCRMKKYKTVMDSFCQRSCGLCNANQDACHDKEYDKCKQWNKYNLCASRDKRIKEAIMVMCAKTCGACSKKTAAGIICKDDFSACSQWKKKGHCESRKQFMNKYCKKSCKTCLFEGDHYEDCLDNIVECARYKAAGKCENNRYGMLSFCRKTCGFCVSSGGRSSIHLQGGVPCTDKSSACPVWAKIGYCKNSYENYMMLNCQKSCGYCVDSDSPYVADTDVQSRRIATRPCYNDIKACEYWARIGMCRLRPDLMFRRCKLSCRACIPEKKCKNIEDDKNCKHWAKLGKCASRASFMIEKCPKSCNACPSREIKTKPAKPIGILCPTACKKFLEEGLCAKSTTRRCRRTCFANGCDAVPLRLDGFCGNPMGIGWDYKLPDSAFSASSVLENGKWDFGAHNARLYKEDDPIYRRVGGWCSKGKKNQWLQVDLGSIKLITAVATQGRDKFFEHVKSYELGFSHDGKTFCKYKEKGTTKVFRGNCDHFTPVVNPLNGPHTARYVRFYPKTYNNICMRVEIYGCNNLEGKALKRYGNVIDPMRKNRCY